MSTTTPHVPARDRSRQQIYDLILERGAATRTDLVDATGMSRSAVNSAVNKLIRDGKATELAPDAKGPGSGSGRPPVTVVPLASGRPVAGLDFGHSHVWVAIADALGVPLADRRVRIDVDYQAIGAMDIGAKLLIDLKAELGITDLQAVVAGIPGPIDSRTGLVKSPTILAGWVGLSPAAELGGRLGVDVHVENDAVLGAHAELRRGAGQHHRNFLYVKASHGIGAGLVIDGRPYTGSTGIAGEIGHTHLPGNTDLCRCGQRGCLETAVSVEALRGQLQHTHPHLDVSNLDLSTVTDPIGERMLNEAGRTLGRVLADLCNLINPGGVIVGGELGSSGPAFIEGVRSSIQRYAQPATAAAIEVRPSTFGIRTELMGALHLAAGKLSR
ncbi:ROK family transcriptional regulator [Nakamurella silvestris]|nr:ROK family transcriptional regulator [Nakamurella silvestris]